MKKTTEDYLEAIFILKRKNGYARGVDIAKYLSFSPPSVSRALLKLHEAGYIDYDENGMIILTEAGGEIAASVCRRHEFFKNMLTGAGVDEQTADEEACKIEHDVSDDSFKKLSAAFPRF
ncbi:MAG: metal-dependent transcriptional regulator [Firmicutes bacterium]|nr:metal-dependent transcriptional regulator [Bacillota bacterium]